MDFKDVVKICVILSIVAVGFLLVRKDDLGWIGHSQYGLNYEQLKELQRIADSLERIEKKLEKTALLSTEKE